MISILKITKEIILQKNTISILPYTKLQRGIKPKKNVEGVTFHNQCLVIL